MIPFYLAALKIREIAFLLCLSRTDLGDLKSSSSNFGSFHDQFAAENEVDHGKSTMLIMDGPCQVQWRSPVKEFILDKIGVEVQQNLD